MATTSKSSAINISLAVALVSLMLTFVFSVIVDEWLQRNRMWVLASIGTICGESAKAENIRFSLLHGITIRNLEIKNPKSEALPSDITVENVYIRPGFSLGPSPAISLGEISFIEPSLAIQSDLEGILRAAQWLSKPSTGNRHLGFLILKPDISSLQIENAHITLLSANARKPWIQKFEHVKFLLKRRGNSEKIWLAGNIDGHPDASFEILASMKKKFTGETETSFRFNFQKFTAEYLRPHLQTDFEIPQDALTAMISFKLRKNTFSSQGAFEVPAIGNKTGWQNHLIKLFAPRLRYQIRGRLEDSRCVLDKIKLKAGQVGFKGHGYINFAGDQNNYWISLLSEEFELKKVAPFMPWADISSGKLRLHLKLLGSPVNIYPVVDFLVKDGHIRDKQRRIDWSQVSARIRFSRNRFTVSRFMAFMDNLPVGIVGEIRRFDSPRFRFEAFTYPGQLRGLRYKNPVNLWLGISGERKDNYWNAAVKFRQTRFRSSTRLEEYWGLTINHARLAPFEIINGRKINGVKIAADWIEIDQPIEKHLQRINLEKPVLAMTGNPNLIRIRLFNALFHGTRLAFETSLTANRWPYFSCLINLMLWETNAEEFLPKLGIQWPLKGKMTVKSTIRIQDSRIDLKGQFKITQGRIGPTPLLSGLADKTALESLREISFRKLAGNVEFKDGLWKFTDLKLLGENLGVWANLQWIDKYLLGRVTLKFPEQAIRDSSALKWLVRFVGTKNWVDLDFKIAGSAHAPRIQWLSGEFKRKLQSRLPPWLQGILASEIEKQFALSPT